LIAALMTSLPQISQRLFDWTESRVPFNGEDPLSACPRQTRAEQGRAGGGRAQGNAIQAQALSERFAVAESILKGHSDSIFRETFRQLARNAFRLPGFDKDQCMFYTSTFAWIVCNLDIKLIFAPIGIQHACAVFAQGVEPFFPGAEHGDVTSRLRKPRGKESRERARADDKNICVHLHLHLHQLQVLVSVIDFFQ
jgi:hypothetical protein